MTKKEHAKETKRLTALKAHWTTIKTCAEQNMLTAATALRNISAMQADLDDDQNRLKEDA